MEPFRMVPVVLNQTITSKPPPQRVNTSCSLPTGEYSHMVSTLLLLSDSYLLEVTLRWVCEVITGCGLILIMTRVTRAECLETVI